jgi:hypothetical protein
MKVFIIKQYMNDLTLNTLETFAKRWAHHSCEFEDYTKNSLDEKKKNLNLFQILHHQ